jgi:hypothetical protein
MTNTDPGIAWPGLQPSLHNEEPHHDATTIHPVFGATTIAKGCTKGTTYTASLQMPYTLA